MTGCLLWQNSYFIGHYQCICINRCPKDLNDFGFRVHRSQYSEWHIITLYLHDYLDYVVFGVKTYPKSQVKCLRRKNLNPPISTWSAYGPALTPLKKHKLPPPPPPPPPLVKMAAISKTIFSHAFSWMKSFVFWLKFQWALEMSIALYHRCYSTISFKNHSVFPLSNQPVTSFYRKPRHHNIS